MDSLTQFVLGAAVSTACLGKTIGPRKAAILGGLLGTVPDLDVFIPFDDPVDSFVYHRGWTHSIFVHALAAPVIGEGITRFIKGLRHHRWLVYVTVFLCLSTHTLIDSMTVYGTRIFWPVYPDPVGVGSIFIIDPVYSLPLLAVVIWALFKRDWSSQVGGWTAAVLVVTSGYMALSVGIQRYVEGEARQIFESAGRVPERIFAIAAPFNILLWKVIGLDEDKYQNLYISLLDRAGDSRIYSHPRHPDLVACLRQSDAYRKLDWFSRGYNRAERVGDRIVISDLRMGLTPGYAFRFAIGRIDGEIVQQIAPRRDTGLVRVEEGDFAWLWTRMQGKPLVREVELKKVAPISLAINTVCGEGLEKTR